MLDNIDTSQLKAIIGLLQTYLLYAILIAAVVLLISALVVKKVAPQKIKPYTKGYLMIFFGFFIGAIFSITSLEIARMVLKDEITYVFWMQFALTLWLILSVVGGALIKATKAKILKPYSYICLGITVIYLVVLFSLLPKTESDYSPTTPLLYYSLTAILIAIMSVIVLICGKNQPKTHSTKQITYAAVCIALSYGLSYIKLFSMPQGGSVTLASLLPLMIYSFLFGVRKGVMCGIIYGLMQLLQSPQVYEPIQILIDYPLAFGFIGLAGMLRGKIGQTGIKRTSEFVIGAAVATLLRFVSHIISGSCVFYSWMPDTYSNPWIYSIAYNSYVLVDLAIVLAVSVFVFSNTAFTNLLDKTTATTTQNTTVN